MHLFPSYHCQQILLIDPSIRFTFSKLFSSSLQTNSPSTPLISNDSSSHPFPYSKLLFLSLFNPFSKHQTAAHSLGGGFHENGIKSVEQIMAKDKFSPPTQMTPTSKRKPCQEFVNMFIVLRAEHLPLIILRIAKELPTRLPSLAYTAATCSFYLPTFLCFYTVRLGGSLPLLDKLDCNFYRLLCVSDAH